VGKFSQRSYEKELMDDLMSSGEVLKETLRELKTVNRWLGGNHVTTSGLKFFVQRRPQKDYLVADIGCGGGDMIQVMNSWADTQKAKFRFLGIDANPNIVELARKRNPGPNIKYLTQNVFDESFKEQKVDIATCTLFTHHFTDEELILLFSNLKKTSRLGFLVNDLHRHPLAYYSIKSIVDVFSNSAMVKNDAPLSVLRSFIRADWEWIFREAGIEEFEITWHWAFRWRVIVLF